MTHVGDKGLAALCRSPHLAGLRSINLFGAGIGAAGLEALADSPPLPRLRRLHLGADRFPPGSLARLFRVAGFAVRELSVGVAEFAAADLAALAESPAAPRLRALSVGGFDSVGDECLRALAACPFEGLRDLQVGYGSWTAAGFAVLLRSGRLGSVRRLSLSPTSAESAAVRRAVHRSPLVRRLRELELPRGRSEAPVLRALLRHKRPLRLPRFAANLTARTLPAWEEVAARGTLSGVTELTLDGAAPGALAAAGGPGRFPELRGLTLGRVGVDEFRAFLAGPVFGQLDRLRLWLSYEREEQTGAALLGELAAVWGRSALSRVDLSWSLTADHVRLLTAAPPPPRLTELGVGSYNLKPDYEALAGWPGLRRLRWLRLSNASVKIVEGLTALAASPHAGPLLRVDIHNGRAADADRAVLRAALGLRVALSSRKYPRTIVIGADFWDRGEDSD